MKTIVVAVLWIGFALSSPLFGDDGSRSTSGKRDILSSKGSLAYGRNVIGQPVRNQDGRVIGRIHEIIIDPKEGKILYGVVDVGANFLGIGDERVSVPWSSLNLSPTQSGYVLNVETSALDRAPVTAADTRRSGGRVFEGTVQELNDQANTLKAKKMGVVYNFVLPEGETVSVSKYKPGEEVLIYYSVRDDGTKVVSSIAPASDERGTYRSTSRKVDSDVDRSVETKPGESRYAGTVEEINPQERTIKIKKMLISHTFKLDEGLPTSTLDRVKVGDEVDVVYADQQGTKVLRQITRQ